MGDVAAPVPRMRTGLAAARMSDAASATAPREGPGRWAGALRTEPQEMRGVWMGEKRTSMGMSRRTGPNFVSDLVERGGRGE